MKGQDYVVKRMDITSEIAAEWLGRTDGGNYRSLNKRYAEPLMRALKNGEWRNIPDPICLDDTGATLFDGRVIQGQHRLYAVATTGIPIKNQLVAFNVRHENEIAFDIGKPRKFDDHARYYSKDYNHVALAVARVLEFGADNRYPALQPYEQFALVEKYQDAIDFVLQGQSTRYIVAPVAAVLCMAYYYPEYRERLVEFMVQIRTGKGIREGDSAAAVVRDMLYVDSEKTKRNLRNKSGRGDLFRKAQSAFYHYIRHAEIRKLYGTKNILFPIKTTSSGKVVADR